jgi:uncharacterized protein
MDDLERGLLSDIASLPVIDTHEHLPFAESDRPKDVDVLREYLSHYLSSDLVSAGLPSADLERAKDTGIPLAKRWDTIEPFWEACRYTGYARALDAAVRGVYDIDGISRGTIAALDAAFRKALAPGHFRRVLKELCGIEVSLLDGFTGRFETDPQLFRRMWQPRYYVLPDAADGKGIPWVEGVLGRPVRTLDDWLEGFDRELDEAVASGIAGLKCALAYDRSIAFAAVPVAEARTAFAGVIAAWDRAGRAADAATPLPVPVQDFVMHHWLRRAAERGLTCQFHTGLLEGNGNLLGHSDPMLLNPLFLAYPKVRFDLFHIGWPFTETATALCKMFPNVFVDMCWAHIISPVAARRALSGFLDALPFTKISAFGGDYLFVDGVYGHLAIARENVARVLAEKVREGTFGRNQALAVARALFRDNPARIFGLEK